MTDNSGHGIDRRTLIKTAGLAVGLTTLGYATLGRLLRAAATSSWASGSRSRMYQKAITETFRDEQRTGRGLRQQPGPPAARG